MVYLETGCDDEYDLMLYPNPLSIYQGVLNVKLYSEREEIDLIIVDVLGRMVKRTNLSTEQEWNTIRLDVTDLPIGTYFVKQLGNRGAARFIIQE